MTQPPEGEVLCPSCTTPNRAGARFCRKCGATLPAVSAAPPVVTPAAPPADAPTAPAAGQADVPTAPAPAAPTLPPTVLGTPPPQPPAGYRTATYEPPPPPGKRRPPWLLIGLGAAALLLLVCVAGLYALFARGAGEVTAALTATAAAAIAPTEVAAEPTEAPTEAAAEPTEAPAATEAPTVEPTPDTSPAETAEAEAAATAAAQRQTAIALALATSVPTATPRPVALEPEPGTLALADYQQTVGALGQRLFETYDRGERTKAIWTQFENDAVRARLRDNFYALTLKGPGRNMWETWDRDLGDTYNVELAVAFETTGAPASVGIAFDVQPEGDNGVFFEVFNDRTWQLRTVRDGSLAPEATTGRIAFSGLQDGVGTNVLWVVRQPGQVQLWINSAHVATVPAGPFAGGRAGVIASSREGLEGEATVIADNFRVRTP